MDELPDEQAKAQDLSNEANQIEAIEQALAQLELPSESVAKAFESNSESAWVRLTAIAIEQVKSVYTQLGVPIPEDSVVQQLAGKQIAEAADSEVLRAASQIHHPFGVRPGMSKSEVSELLGDLQLFYATSWLWVSVI